MSTSPRFLMTFSVSTLLLLSLTAVLNRVVDPYGAFHAPMTDVFSGKRELVRTRIGKAELCRHYAGPTVLVGSSRTRIGYDPASSAFPDGPACNLGLSGTNFHELLPVMRLTAAQPNVRRILLMLDFEQFSAARTVSEDFPLSLFNPERDKFAYTCDLLWNEEGTRSALVTLAHTLRNEPAPFTALGFEHPAGLQHKLARPRLAELTLEKALSPRGTLGSYQYSQPRLDGLRQTVRLCRARRIELIVILHPVHALMLDAIRQAGLWPTYERWQADVVRIVEEESQGQTPVWDFNGWSPYTTEPLLGENGRSPAGRWFWEASHARAELGELILRRVFNTPAADPSFGVKLTCRGLAAHVRHQRAARQAWMAAHGAEERAVERIAVAAGFTDGRAHAAIAQEAAPVTR